METVNIIIDESYTNNRDTNAWLGLLSFCVVPDEFFSTVTKKIIHNCMLSARHSFSNSKPHYTEDTYTQNREFIKELSKYGFTSFVAVKKYQHIIVAPLDLYKDLLGNMLNNILKKYLKAPWTSTNFRLFFENAPFLNSALLEQIIKESGWYNIAKEISISLVSKEDYDWITFIPDYLAGIVLWYITNTDCKPQSTASRQFEEVVDKISLISLEVDSKISYYHISDPEKKNDFTADWYGKIK